MAIRTVSLWSGVPDAERLREMLAAARDTNRSALDRQQALSYLTGAVKVLARIEARAALAEHLRQQIKTIKSTMYYGDSA